MSDIDAYLGDFAGDLSDEQKDDLARAFDAIDARYPLDDEGQDDWADERESACTAAAMVTFGDDSLGNIADQWQGARRFERDRMASLTGAIIAAAQTMPETQVAAAAGVDRMTVRKALGKR